MKNLFKLLVALALLAFLFWEVDPHQAWQTITTATPWMVAAALLMQLLSQVTAAVRWKLIMHRLGFHHPFRFYLASYFKGALFNQVLPTSIGGDAYRIAEVHAHGAPLKEAFYAIFIDRIVGLIGLLLLNILALWWAPADLLPAVLLYGLVSITLAALTGFALLLWLHRLTPLYRWSFTRLFAELSERFYRVYRHPRDLAVQIGLSLLTHLFAMLAIFGLGHAVDINQPIGIYLALTPPAILLTILPLSFAGWGVREGALIGLFMLVGAAQAQVLAMSVLYGMILIFAALPGVFFYLKSKHRWL
ncbi:MAG TPA: flippase-like domain-containing protein [Piscirickettsiaceae bacterium]|nr:flippase-like domain-containing protein [Piscirickettsiaceae bacterium]